MFIFFFWKLVFVGFCEGKRKSRRKSVRIVGRKEGVNGIVVGGIVSMVVSYGCCNVWMMGDSSFEVGYWGCWL